jgi:ABC-type dipeptide/oligopeptide/nickel transport system ATPase component
VIIADEATSSLDVTIQAKIIRLLKKLNREQGMTIVFISHDLGLVGFMADDVAVMTQGRIVEYGPASQIMEDPKDNYTKELLKNLKNLKNWPNQVKIMQYNWIGKSKNLTIFFKINKTLNKFLNINTNKIKQLPNITAILLSTNNILSNLLYKKIKNINI